MRKLAVSVFAVAVLAACSDDGSKDQAAVPTAIKLQPGLWEMTSEVTDMTINQKAAPAPMKASGKVTINSCITAAQVDTPDAGLFAGEKNSCKYDNFYMSRGRLSAQMTCTQQGMDGNVVMSVDGNYTAEAMDVTSELNANVAGTGDMRVRTKLVGKRVGECPAEGSPPAKV